MPTSRPRRRKNSSGGAQAGSGLGARLRNRPRPTLQYPLLVDDPTEPQRVLEEAQARLRQARLRYSEEDHEAARQYVASLEMADEPNEPALAAARRGLERHDRLKQQLADAEEQVEQAQQAVNACWETLTLRAMRPDAYEALLVDHPPTVEQIAAAKEAGREPPIFNDDTFQPALIAATVQADATADDWAAFLTGDDEHGAAPSERNELWALVIGLNERARFAAGGPLPFA